MKNARTTVLAATLLMSVAIGLVACHQPNQPDRMAPTSPPAAGCSASLASSLGCETFHSLTATQSGKSVEWVGESSIDLRAEDLGGTPTLVVTTPCNSLNIPVDIRDDALTTVSITSTMKGCDATRSAQQRWVEDFFDAEVQWKRTYTTLTLSKDQVVIEFMLGT